MKPKRAAEMPYPGDELVYRVTGGASRESFFESGRQSVLEFERALASVSRRWESFDQVLDFGCGCGRVMMWLREHTGKTSFHGVDIDERAIRWAEENLPFATFKVNQPLPPLPYEDGFFDLVMNHSVFTHVNKDYQDKWLEELHRVTRPGAILILSVHGQYAFEKFMESLIAGAEDPGPYVDRFNNDGLVFIEEDTWLGGPFPGFYHSTFHAPWYVFDHWQRFFKIRAYYPRGDLGFQDLVVFEREDGPVLAPTGEGGAMSTLRRPAALNQAPNAGTALDTARAILNSDPTAGTTRFGIAGKLARRLVLRIVRNYTEHQRALDTALLESVENAASPDVSARTIATLKEAVRQQGERINRLEADLFEAVDALGKSPANGKP